MKAKDLVRTGLAFRNFRKVVVHSRNGFEFEGQWDTPNAIEDFSLWVGAEREVVKWEIDKKTLYIIIK